MIIMSDIQTASKILKPQHQNIFTPCQHKISNGQRSTDAIVVLSIAPKAMLCKRLYASWDEI